MWKRPDSKNRREFHWFKLWTSESYSIRQMIRMSGLSRAKLQRIKNRWLAQEPPSGSDHPCVQYGLFDGTYFGKHGCLITLMTSQADTIVASRYVPKESYDHVIALLDDLKEQGLQLRSVTLDGHKHVIRAFQDIWPGIIVQRCLYHIQRQGLSWLRTYPKTLAGRELRELLLHFIPIRTQLQRDGFLDRYAAWRQRWQTFVKSLPWTSVAFKDLKRTMALVENALPNMFHYLGDSKISPTTNRLEGFYSRLKADLQKHRGLSVLHRIGFLKWYCYFKNQKSSNTF